MAAANVDEYIGMQEKWAADILTELRSVIKEYAPDATESIKWAQPVYEDNGPCIYIKAFKKNINFGFWRGVQLEDPKGLLSGTGEKMRHVKIHSVDEMDRDALGAFVKQAVSLNRELGSAAMKKGL
jgi:hypothetical protein